MAWALALAIAVTWLVPLPRAQAVAAEEVSREYLIKAAFIYNFAKFTRWPAESFADPSTPFRVCVYGEDPFGTALDGIAGKTIRKRRIAVRRIDSVEDGTACHLLFISASEASRFAPLLESLSGRPVLTIADMPDFARSGGIINLKTNEEEKVRFEINVATARNAGLRFSSKLLSLAEIAPE